MADDDDGVTEAHDQRLTVHIITAIPQHEPVPGDPHYDLFQKAMVRLKRQRLWKCAIGDDYCAGDIEMHHTHIEATPFASIDLKRVNDAFGLHLNSDDDFQEWIESPGNLEVLCVMHHRGHYGVHTLPHPLWEPLRYRKRNIKPSAEVDQVEGDVEVTKVTATRTSGGDRVTDSATRTRVKAGGRTVSDEVDVTHTEEHRRVPHPR
jgi:hypothetical protein